MGILFKKRRRKAAPVRENYPIPDRIRLSYRKTLLTFANGLAKHTAKFNRLHWLMVLSLFILFAGGINIFLITKSFQTDEKVVFSITPIHKPKYLTQTGEELRNTDLRVSKKEYLHINNFLRYMDSLERSPTGRRVYDSILLNRPGLMDSIRFLENRFQAETIEELSIKFK